MSGETNRMKALQAALARGEGLLSASVACNGARDYGKLLSDVNTLVEGGIDQLLLIFYEPHNMRVASIAPAEVAATKSGLAAGTYSEACFDTAIAVRSEFPDLPIIASGVVPDMITYGMGRFLERLREVGVDALDTPGYRAVADPIGLVKQTLSKGLSYIPPVSAEFLHVELPEHRTFLSETVSIGSDELFFVPGVSGDTRRVNGDPFRHQVAALRDAQQKRCVNGAILSIGGINTPEDAYQLTHVAGTDGVHFSSAYLNRVACGTSDSEIISWLKDVRCAMKR